MREVLEKIKLPNDYYRNLRLAKVDALYSKTLKRSTLNVQIGEFDVNVEDSTTKTLALERSRSIMGSLGDIDARHVLWKINERNVCRRRAPFSYADDRTNNG